MNKWEGNDGQDVVSLLSLCLALDGNVSWVFQVERGTKTLHAITNSSWYEFTVLDDMGIEQEVPNLGIKPDFDVVDGVVSCVLQSKGKL